MARAKNETNKTSNVYNYDAFNALEPEEQAAILHYQDMCARANASKLAQQSNLSDAQQSDWDANVAPIMSKLGVGDHIPNHSGLAGSAVLTKADLQALQADCETFLANHNTSEARSLYVKAAGATNTV